MAFLFSQWWVILLLLTAYEAFEGLLRRIKTEDGGLFEYESWPNIVMDVVVGMAGFFVAHLLVGRWAPW